jgi:hypothetical protein
VPGIGFIPVTRWVVIDTARAAQACARLEAAASDGILGPVSAAAEPPHSAGGHHH